MDTNGHQNRRRDQHHHHHHHNNQQHSLAPRLCHIRKWDDFDGYGFNLHAEKGKSGQFIGKVDEGSPSEAAGLRQGDRIVEVNEINIAGETHKQVVERIKAFPGETKLLVVDQRTDEHYRQSQVPIKGTMPGVVVMRTPERSPEAEAEESREMEEMARGMKKTGISNGGGGGSDDRRQKGTSDAHSISSSCDGHSNQDATAATTTTNGNGSRLDDDSVSTKSSSSAGNQSIANSSSNGIGSVKAETNGNGTGGAGSADAASNSSASSTTSSSAATSTAATAAAEPSLDLAMSAKELRAKLAMRKKYDPKKESLGFKDKFDIVQKL